MKKNFARIMVMVLALAMLLAGCGGGPAATTTTLSADGTVTTANDAAADDAAVTTTAAPATAAGGQATVQPDTLIVAVDAEGTTFDPFDYADLDSGFLIRQVHEPLAFVDSTSESGFTPILAESWEYPTPNTIIIHLRKGVKFQTGDEMKASDVLFSMKTTKAKGLLQPDNWDNLDLENAKMPDEYTLEISTFEPSSFSFAWLLCEMFQVLSEKAYTETGAEAYAHNPTGGTGPYILENWIVGDRVTFKRNENYWGEKPQYKTLILRFIVDGTARTMAIESGDVDVAYSCPTADINTLSSVAGYSPIKQVTSGVNYLWFNNLEEHLKDVRVRQALSYALDLPTMVPIAYNNMGTVGDSVFGPSVPQKSVPTTKYTKDIEKAKQLMADAGFADGFDLEIVITDRAARKMLAEMMKNAWAPLNVNLTITVFELSTILESLNADDYDLTILAEGGFHGEAFRPYLHSQGANNYSNFSNARVDELFDKAVATSDHDESMALYAELQEICAQEVPILPLQYDQILNVLKSNLSYSIDPTYNFMAARFYYIRYAE